jgi:hypothetical protein
LRDPAIPVALQPGVQAGSRLTSDFVSAACFRRQPPWIKAEFQDFVEEGSPYL